MNIRFSNNQLDKSRDMLIKWTDKELILQMYQLLKDFHNFAERVGLEYWIAYRTLLGAVRHNGIESHNDDIGVFTRNAEPLISNFYLFEELGYEVKEWWSGYRISKAGGERVRANKHYHCPGCEIPACLQDRNICECESGYPFIDVFRSHKDGEVLRHTDERAEKELGGNFIENMVFPLKLYDYGSFQVFGPNDPLPFLSHVYGDDWNEIDITVTERNGH